MEDTENLVEQLDKMSEDDLSALALKMSYFVPDAGGSAGWQGNYGDTPASPYYPGPNGAARRDEDGAPTFNGMGIKELQAEAYRLFEMNPQVYTATMDMVGRLSGQGFGTWCDIPDVQDFIEEIYTDPRNRLPLMFPKYFTRAKVQGELFLVLTVHTDGFVEVDFREPSTVGGIGKDRCGIVYHPKKTNMPLVYQFEDGHGHKEQIPSIFIARYPELLNLALEDKTGVSADLLRPSMASDKAYKPIGGFRSFVIQWDMAPIKARNTPLLMSTIRWVNLYETLKMYEIDHKKASGSYLWVVTFENLNAFKDWLSLKDEDRKRTGLMAKKTPGGMLFMPPGMKIEAQNPQLPKISGTDTDIMQMVVSGLNSPQDMVTGDNTGTYAAVKASRGPMTDRVSNEVSYCETFLRYDFWDSIIFLASIMKRIKYKWYVREAYAFKKGTGTDADAQERVPLFRKVQRKVCMLLEFTFPVSDVQDLQTLTAALLGVKHGSLNATMGIPNAAVAKKLGFGNYKRSRLEAATEDEYYPPLQPQVDQNGATQEAAQEKPGSVPAKPATPTTKSGPKRKDAGKKQQ